MHLVKDLHKIVSEDTYLTPCPRGDRFSFFLLFFCEQNPVQAMRLWRGFLLSSWINENEVTVHGSYRYIQKEENYAKLFFNILGTATNNNINGTSEEIWLGFAVTREWAKVKVPVMLQLFVVAWLISTLLLWEYCQTKYLVCTLLNFSDTANEISHRGKIV